MIEHAKQLEVEKNELPSWWRWFEHHGDSFLARVALAVIAMLDSIIIFFPPEIAISALVLAKPRKWIFYTLFTTFFTIVGALITYMLGVFFFDTYGSIILSLVGGAEAYAATQEIFSGNNVLWGIIFVGVTPIPWVPFLLAAGVYKVNIFVFVLGVVIARVLRFGIIAFIVAHLGQRGVALIHKTLRIMGTTGMIVSLGLVIILAIFGANFLL